jgi:hypothetical protein
LAVIGLRGAGAEIDSMVQLRLVHPEREGEGEGGGQRGGGHVREAAVLPLASAPLGPSQRGWGYTKRTANMCFFKVAEKSVDANGRPAVKLHLDSRWTSHITLPCIQKIK